MVAEDAQSHGPELFALISTHGRGVIALIATGTLAGITVFIFPVKRSPIPSRHRAP
jgi:hypothetical protein